MPASESEVCESFRSLLNSHSDRSTAVVAIEALMLVLEKCKAGTLQELVLLLNQATEAMKTRVDCSSISVASGCQLFLRFITLASEQLETQDDFENVRKIMMKRGHVFLDKLAQARPKIAKISTPFLRDGSKVLVHSYSKCVLLAIKEAHHKQQRFKIFVTESSLDDSGRKMKRALDELNIPSTVILDASVGHVMNQVDYVLMGAEGVVESGGIVNKIGSYTIALCAKEMNKQVYVLCESFKFVRLYPLHQQDLPKEYMYHASTLEQKGDDLSETPPLVDYTPPSFITLLFTDLGILTPSAVSDELIKLYL